MSLVGIYLCTSILLSSAAPSKAKRCDTKVSPTPPYQKSPIDINCYTQEIRARIAKLKCSSADLCSAPDG